MHLVGNLCSGENTCTSCFVLFCFQYAFTGFNEDEYPTFFTQSIKFSNVCTCRYDVSGLRDRRPDDSDP